MALLVAVHPQPLPVVTLTDPCSAGRRHCSAPDERHAEIEQPPLWLTVKVWPATVNVPLRAVRVAADALYCTSPLPLPDPEVMVSHVALLDAVHPQPAPLVTATLPVAAADGTDTLSGEIANEHPGVWEMVIVWPATTALPERDGPVVAATANVTLPVPAPLARP